MKRRNHCPKPTTADAKISPQSVSQDTPQTATLVTPTMPSHDLFISHASEDKQDVVLPLVDKLRRIGFSVWLDKDELKAGSSLSEAIDRGLAHALYGLVVISPSFLRKSWPKRELRGLVARETGEDRDLIIPIWHDLSHAELLATSPTLADKIALNTIEGLDSVASGVSKSLVGLPGATSLENASFADMVHILLGCHDLMRLRAEYELTVDSATTQRWLHQMLETALAYAAHSWGPPILGKIPAAIQDEEMLRETVGSALQASVYTLPGGPKDNNFGPTRLTDFWRSRIHGLRNQTTETAHKTVQRVIDLKDFGVLSAIDIPLSERLMVVASIWRMLSNIAVHDADASLNARPHPLQSFVLSAQRRVQHIVPELSIVPSTASIGTALFDNSERLVSLILHEEIEATTVAKDWIINSTAAIEAAIANHPALIGSDTSSLNEAENYFINRMLQRMAEYKEQMSRSWKIMMGDLGS